MHRYKWSSQDNQRMQPISGMQAESLAVAPGTDPWVRFQRERRSKDGEVRVRAGQWHDQVTATPSSEDAVIDTAFLARVIDTADIQLSAPTLTPEQRASVEELRRDALGFMALIDTWQQG